MMMFRDRADAGRCLARLLREQLPALRGVRPMVIATFPSGVLVGRALADALDAPLDVLVARRLDAPGCADIGIGAVACGGARVLDTMTIRMLGVSDDYIAEVSRAESAEAERQMARVRAATEPPPVDGRTVVLADDGTASRWGARAAILSLREAGAARIIVAVPVASSDVRDVLAREADAVVCGHVPERFLGVAAHFDDFSEPDEATVRRLLGPPRGRVARYVAPRVPAVVPHAAPQPAPVTVVPADL